MKPEIAPDLIKGYECKHAVYRQYKPRDWEHGRKPEDIVLVKENIHLKDGTIIPNIRLVKNYQREFWITKPGFQNHKDKKEWELESRCEKRTCSQVNLTKKVAEGFGRQANHSPLRHLARSPYLYGCDVTTPVLIKQFYKSKWEDCLAKSTVAVLDIETDVVWGTEEIISCSLTFGAKSVLGVTKKFLGTIQNPEDRVHKRFKEMLKGIIARNAVSSSDMDLCKQQLKEGKGVWRDAKTVELQGKEDTIVATVVDGAIEKAYAECHVDKRVKDLEIIVTDTPGQLCKAIIDRAHAWRPDFVSIWNIAFDLPKIIWALESEQYDLGEVFSDPCVPKEYRTAKFVMDNAIKVTQSGKSAPKHPADLWHTMDCMASFYFVDSMATYKKIRAAKGNEPSYSLDAILGKILKIGKLNVEGVDGNHNLGWHVEMQRNYKIEYLIYNQFDCISVEMLDEKTNDLGIAIGQICDASEYKRFPSIPRRTVDKLHFYCRGRGMVIGTTSDEMTDDNDDEVIGINGHIVTLPSYLVSDNGIPLFKELPDVKSSMYAHVYDLDCVSTYPTTGEVMNISRETTYRELARMEGIEEQIQRDVGINLTGGKVNALEICTVTMNFPPMDVLLAKFVKEKNITLQ